MSVCTHERMRLGAGLPAHACCADCGEPFLGPILDQLEFASGVSRDTGYRHTLAELHHVDPDKITVRYDTFDGYPVVYGVPAPRVTSAPANQE
jgi:hypothetical protein